MSRDRHHPRLRLGSSIVLLAWAVAFPAAVLAHAELETVSPADGAVVTEQPAEIVMTFSEALDPAKSSIVLVDASGATVLRGGVVDAADATRMTLAVDALEPGEYELRWTSASAADGDIDHGTTTFAFSPPPSPTATTAPPSASASAAASPTPSATVAPSPSAAPTTPTTSTTDLLIPIVAAILLVVLLGAWLLRTRPRGARP